MGEERRGTRVGIEARGPREAREAMGVNMVPDGEDESAAVDGAAIAFVWKSVLAPGLLATTMAISFTRAASAVGSERMAFAAVCGKSSDGRAPRGASDSGQHTSPKPV